MPECDKTPFKEEEKKLRAQYHVEVGKWEKEQRQKAAMTDGKQTANNNELASCPKFVMHPPGHVPSKGKFTNCACLIMSFSCRHITIVIHVLSCHIHSQRLGLQFVVKSGKGEDSINVLTVNMFLVDHTAD